MRRRRGFTLLEVLLAITLLVMLTASIASFTWNLLDRRATLLEVGRDVHAAAAVIDRIEADLLGAIAGDAGGGAGIDGTAESLRILTRGVWISAAAEEGRGRGGDLQRSEYRFDPGSARLTAARSPVETGRGASGGAAPEVVSDRVERVRFRYFDGREWLSSFDSLAQDSLPVAVEVAVWMAAPGASPRVLSDEEAPEESLIGGPSPRSFPGEEAAEPGLAPELEFEQSGWAEQRRWGEPDRLRVIVVPDGPVTSWREGS